MAKQMLADLQQEGEITADKSVIAPRGHLKRMVDTISTNIGLYEIRVNLLLWGLFRTGGRERGNLGKE